MNKLYLCVTLYHLYLTMLLINRDDNKEGSVILLNANDEQIYKQFCALEVKLVRNGYKVNCRFRNKVKDILGLEGIENKRQYKVVKRYWRSSFDEGFELYNFAWNCQYVYSTADIFYKKCLKAHFIEEGAMTAINPPQPKWKVLLKKICGASVDFYKDDKIEGIYVQKVELYPAGWAKKLKRLNISALLENLDNEMKDMLLSIFLGDTLVSIQNNNYGRIGIIYTQPLSEDGFIEEELKISYYNEMVRYYCTYGKPIVKLHPRDLSNYNFSTECLVLPSYFPSEILNLLNINFEYAVGICTSAVPNTKARICLNINENFLKDLNFKVVPLK